MTGRARTASEEETDVLVVGAGPVGLWLACDLRALGVGVTVVEQLERPTGQSRASTLHARTMELIAERDLLDALGPPARSGGGHFAGLPLDVSAADPGHRFAGISKAPQTRIEQVLAERADATGARVLRGHRVTAVDAGPHGVRIEAQRSAGETVHLRGAYLAGCDGEHSTVRRLCGFDVAGPAGRRELLRADITGIQVPDRRFERHPNGVAISSRGPDGVTRVMLHEYGCDPADRTAGPEFPEFVQRWRRITGDDIGAGTPTWIDAFDDTCRQVTRYRTGRVLLAGDAAHQQLPVGGQAINLGLQDAADLGVALAAQFTGPADERLLESYQQTRHTIGERALTSIAAQALLLFGGPRTDAVRAVVGELLELAPARRTVARVISGLSGPRPTRAAAAPQPLPTDRRTTDMTTLAGRNALVTGGSRGIGRAVALRLGRQGALVAVHYGHDRAAADEVVEAVERDGGSAFAVHAELGVPGDVHELFLGLEAGLKERTGGTDLHIVVNNAGVMGGVAPEDVVPELFDRLFAVNARAPFFIVQRALGLMPDGGRIVNISSGLTRVANPQETAYAMTKGAIDQLTLHLAKHLGPRGITVNSVGPGITDNGSAVFSMPEAVEQMAQLSAFGRVGRTEDIASVVAFLVSDDAGWVTGSYLDASGGTLLGG